jgi:hypothetical protein
MSFWTEMVGQQQGNTAEIYQLSRTDHQNYYTSYHENLEVDNVTYISRTIKRSAVPSIWHASEVTCTITGTTDDDGVFNFLLDTIPDTKVRIKIYRVLLASGNTQIIFDGFMQTFSVKKSQASVKFESINYITRYKIPRIRIQSYCNHRLFDNNCGLSQVAYRIGGTIVDTSDDPSVLSNQLVVEDAYNDDFGESISDKANDYFTAGVAHYNGHYRYISKSQAHGVGGDKRITLQINFPSDVVGVGTQLDLWPGCSKSPAVCTDKFDNFDHFLGFPYVPSDQQSGDLTIIE